MRLARRGSLLVALLLASLGGSALAAPLTTLLATYDATPPAAIAASATVQVSVTLTNTGSDTWQSTGTNPVDLSYHWYDTAGNVVVWDGVRTPLGADVAPSTQRVVVASVVAPAVSGTYVLRLALVKEGVAWLAPSGPYPVAVQPASYLADYQIAAPPSAVPAGGSLTVSVALTNRGNTTWNASGANPVDLSYHWYDQSGASVVVWDGARTALGGDVAPNASRTIAATVAAPAAAGSYTLRLALVKEGVAWFAPSQAMPVSVLAAYAASFVPPTLPGLIAGGTYTVSVTVRNSGAASWNATGTNPIDLSYHWLDAAGNAVVWDGVRTRLSADVAPGASVSLAASVTAPLTAGSYTLVLDMVREGVSWFAGLGSTPSAVPAAVSAARYAASYDVAATITAYWGEQKTVQVTVTNTGNTTWNASGAYPFDLGYHLLDASGNAIVWDGARTQLGTDLAPGSQRTLPVTFTVPTTSGTYTLAIDMVREGVAWFSQMGVPTRNLAIPVTSGLNAGYGLTTTPSQVTIGAVIDLTVQVYNYGPRTLPAAGANPVHLSYHIYGANTGTTYVWDGNRGTLPQDAPAGTTTTVPISVAVPSAVGSYILEWDLVQEGIAWFSQLGLPTKREAFSVVSGVVFYGSGFGHGVGMSQYGAQGLATGAAGPAQTGEQIIQHYFPGSTFAFGDVTRPLNRVLLSQPSSQSPYRCGLNNYFAGSGADVVSNGGFKVLDVANGGVVVATAAPGADWQFWARNGSLQIFNNATGTPVQVGGSYVALTAVPLDPNQPLRIGQKDLVNGTPNYYRGELRFTNLGDTLRVINALTYDDYTRGVVSFEMPKSWQAEALKAQAYASRSYAYASYRGTARDYDVSDDQSDQCYGGTSAESPATDAAVAATAGKLVVYGGVIVKTYFSSSSGGYTLDFGCWGTRVVRSGSTWTCTPNAQPPIVAVADPADRLVASPANPRASWSVAFTGADIANAALCAGAGVNIGTLLGVDVSNQAPAGVGHVISVRLIGSNATVDVKAETFLRGCLGLRSTMVRLSPF